MNTLTHIPERLVKALARAPHVPEEDLDAYMERTPPGSPLNIEELTALRWISHGLMAAMTGEVMGCDESHVKWLLRRARYRLRAKNTPHAVAIALRKGVIN